MEATDRRRRREWPAAKAADVPAAAADEEGAVRRALEAGAPAEAEVEAGLGGGGGAGPRTGGVWPAGPPAAGPDPDPGGGAGGMTKSASIVRL